MRVKGAGAARLAAVVLVVSLTAGACGTKHDDPTPTAPATASAAPTASGPTAVPSVTAASQTPLAAEPISVLLIGMDTTPTGHGASADTLILVTVDPANGRAAMFGIPRNMLNLPLPAGATSAACPGWSTTMIMSVYTYAQTHPNCLPGVKGYPALEEVVSAITGVQVAGAIAIDLLGFVAVVDKLGGIDINVPTELRDASYPAPEGTGNIVIDIKPGLQHMDGHTALAYARSRHQDSDYGRMARQQAVLLALRRSVSPTSLVSLLPSLQSLVSTDISSGSIQGLVGAVARVSPCNVKGTEFIPPAYKAALDDATVASIKSVVAGALDAASPSPGASVSPVAGC